MANKGIKDTWSKEYNQSCPCRIFQSNTPTSAYEASFGKSW